MTAKRITMRQIRELLRLRHEAGLSIRQINASTKVSVGKIQSILKKAEELNIQWPLPNDMDDRALAQRFYPDADTRVSKNSHQPDWSVVHQALKKKGLTRQLLWEEDRETEGYQVAFLCPYINHVRSVNCVWF